MNSFSKTSHLMGLLDRFKLFLEFGDLNIPIYFILNVIERVKNKNIIYCDSNTLIRLVVKRVEQKYGIFFSPKTRFLAVKEVYVDRIYTQYKDFTPKLGEVVVDAGSETGDYALICSKYYGASSVYVFEPNKDSFDVIKKNIKLNKCQNVKVFMVGISSVDAKQEVGFNGDTISWQDKGKDIVIEVRKLDSFHINSIDILKIDVEGNEIDAILGGIETIKRFKPRIIIETHSRELRVKVTAILGRVGYKVVHRGRVMFDDNGREITNLFLINSS